MDREDKEISRAHVVASCDDSGVTFIHGETPLQIEENGLVEISYINITEDVIVSELGLLDSVGTDDDNSGHSYENCEAEEGDDNDHIDLNVDEDQKAITNDFLSGKISFQDFISRVESSDDVQSSDEDSSENEENLSEDQNKNDPDYLPENLKTKAKYPKRSVSSKRNISLQARSQESSNQPQILEVSPQSPVKQFKKVTRLAKKLPANLLGKVQ